MAKPRNWWMFSAGVAEFAVGFTTFQNRHAPYVTGIWRYQFAGWLLIGVLLIYRSYRPLEKGE